MTILRSKSTLNIKGFGGRFGNGAQYIDKFVYYINNVGLKENVLLNLSLNGGQKENRAK